jgi:EAL and modified HD-GYP domain-containing signal transduction protein
MMQESPHHTAVAASESPVFFARQPVLDAKRRVWGYELLGGEVREGIFHLFPGQQAATTLGSSTYFGLSEALDRGKKIMIAFDAPGVLAGLPRALPPRGGCLRLRLDAPPAPELLAALEALRAEGYLVALDVAPGSPAMAAARLADVLIMEQGTGALPPAIARLASRKAQTLARGVRSLEQFQTARDQGHTLFQGPFVKEPELVPGRKLTSNEVSRLKMLRLMEGEDPDLEGVAAAVKGDVAVSFRLLALLNSPAFGLLHKVESVDHAVRLLGWDKLRGWLRAVLLADMAGQAEGPRELAALSVQRGRFLELVTTEYDYWDFNPGTMFLLGLFSLLDAILGMPMAEVAGLLPLDAKLQASLRRAPGNDHEALFLLMEALEDGDWEALRAMSARLGFDLETVKTAYAAAGRWADMFLAVRD